MATKTRQRPASTGRFSRSTAPSAGRFHRSTSRTTPRRKPAQSSTPLSALTGLLPGAGSKKPSAKHKGGAKSKAGMAALAGIAGYAVKNRSKLTSRFGNKSKPIP
jgi:hypothetical protein